VLYCTRRSKSDFHNHEAGVFLLVKGDGRILPCVLIERFASLRRGVPGRLRCRLVGSDLQDEQLQIENDMKLELSVDHFDGAWTRRIAL
jgi:hypothetical protein